MRRRVPRRRSRTSRSYRSVADVPKQYVIRSNFLNGVLDPRAAARVETDAYNQGLLVGDNIVPIHLGGMRRRPGTRYIATLPNKLTRVTSGVSISAPNGGTTASANDDSETTLVTTTTNVSTNDPYIVVKYDLGIATSVLFSDTRGILSSGGSSTEFRIQYSTNDSTWTDFGAAFQIVDTTSRSYRRGSTTATSARYWRVVKVGGTDMGSVTVSLGEFSLWTDAGTVSEVKLYAFEVSTTEAYLVALTDRSAQLYNASGLVGVFPSPYEDTDLADLDAASKQDSMVFVHEDHAPRTLLPEYSTFYFDPIAFTHIPEYDFDDSSSPTPVSEVQVITFGSSFAAGDTFQLDLEGARTGSIAYAGDSGTADRAATADNIAKAVQKLYTVPGFSGVTCARTSTRQYTVTFAGASAKDYKVMSGLTLSTKATSSVEITVSQSVNGTSRHEDAWSATRGWPRTVVFYGGRLYFGGSRSLPYTLFGSKVNQVLDYDVGDALDDDAVFVTLAGSQLNAVEGISAGRSLQFFTSGGEFRYAKQQGDPVTPGDAPANQTQFGGAKIRPVSIDGATVFVQRTRKAVRDFRYDYEEDAYNSMGLSSLAPHLVNNVARLAAWNGDSTDEISLVFVVNADGTIAVLNLRRDANVQAWTRWTTQGMFKDAASVVEDVYVAVRRTIDDTEYLFLERLDSDLYLDCAVAAGPGSSITITDITTAATGTGTEYYRTITTSTAHGQAVGDIVTISGVVAHDDYDLNGIWAVAEVVDSTNFRVENTSDVPEGLYVSGGTFYSGDSVTVTGLSHLNGEACRVRGDGFVLENNTPAAGSITVERASQLAEVGLGFTVRMTPMPLNTMTPAGENSMRKRRVSKIRVKVYKTLGLLVNGRVLSTRKMDASNFDEPVKPFSGVLSIEETSNWDDSEDKLVEFSQEDPLPFHILALDVGLEWNE